MTERGRRTWRSAGVALVASCLLGASCETLGPPALMLGNALLAAAAANYGGDYAEEVQIVVGAFAQASEGALQAYLQQKQEREFEASLQPGLDPLDLDPLAGSAGGAIELDVALMKRVVVDGEVRTAPIADHEILRDGGGDPERGDRFRIYLRPSVDCNVYVVAVDATGWVQPLFPSRFPGSPEVYAGATYLLPDETHWYGLDEHRGYQHIYFLASYERKPDLEVMLSRLTSEEREPPEVAEPVGAPVVVEQRWIEQRGLTGIRPGEAAVIAPGSPEAFEVLPVTFGFGVPGQDFVLTRVFQHH